MRRGMDRPPDEITPAQLSVVVMPNGEVICLGKTLGWIGQLGPYLTPDPKPAAVVPTPEPETTKEGETK